MSIFFYQVALAIFPLVLISSFLQRTNYIKELFIPIVCGVIFGFACFSAFAVSANNDTAKIFFDIIYILLLIIFPILFKFKSVYLATVIVFLLAMTYGYEYKFISANFKIFTSSLLDSLSLSNLFMASFAFLIFICIFFLLNSLLKRVNKKVKICFFILILFLLIIDRLGFFGLSLMQEGIIKTTPKLLSVIAKIIYFNSFLPIIFSLILIILGAFGLKFEKCKNKENIIEFREFKAGKFKAFSEFFYALLCGGIIIFISLFYILVASKPPKIDNPTIIEPINNEFKFNAEIVKDNKLHRYAYITDDGHKVRFFLINKFKDKLAPVAVFDACSICGDMGYVKKGDELICISCNVRIFLPSVGKAGGCNPIPLEYKFDGKEIIISLKEIEKGASFFSEVVEKIVTDPVSREKIKNNSKFRYLYYGRTYFFANSQNQAEFEANPEKFVDTNGVLKELK